MLQLDQILRMSNRLINPQRDPHQQTTSKKVSVNSRFLLHVPLDTFMNVVTTVMPESTFFCKKRLKHSWRLLPVIQSSAINLPTYLTNAVTEDL